MKLLCLFRHRWGKYVGRVWIDTGRCSRCGRVRRGYDAVAAKADLERQTGFKIERQIAYQGKKGCRDIRCTRTNVGDWENSECIGWHCSVCDEPCSSQGHTCPDPNQGGSG